LGFLPLLLRLYGPLLGPGLGGFRTLDRVLEAPLHLHQLWRFAFWRAVTVHGGVWSRSSVHDYILQLRINYDFLIIKNIIFTCLTRGGMRTRV
jgi:hypothetical protein